MMNLSDVVAVAIIVAFSMHHRISGILALLVVITCMQTYEHNATKEGFGLPKMPSSSNSAVTDDLSWNTSDEFKQKYCIKGWGDSGNWMYVISPKIAGGPVDASGNPTFNDKSYEMMGRIDNKTVTKANGCSFDSSGSSGVKDICDPKCNWKIKTAKEGFTPTIEVSPVQNMKNVVKDNVRKAKTMTESFFSR
jgi:hypothetical protein